MSIGRALSDLDSQRKALAGNLATKGVSAADTETLAQLVPKVLTIEAGGGSGFFRKAAPIPVSVKEYNPAVYAVEVAREI